MTYSNLKSMRFAFGWIVLICIALTSCEKEQVELAKEVGPDGQPIELTENKATTIASFKLSNGNRIEFVGKTTEDGDELGVIEYGIGVDVKHSPFNNTELSIPDLFFVLNNDSYPTPEIIARVSERKDLQTVEKLDEVISVDLKEVKGFSYQSNEKFASSFVLDNTGLYCSSPTLFQVNYCNFIAPPGVISFCSPNLAISHSHWTNGLSRRHSAGITTACNDRGRVTHYQKNIFGNWQVVHSWNIGF